MWNNICIAFNVTHSLCNDTLIILHINFMIVTYYGPYYWFLDFSVFRGRAHLCALSTGEIRANYEIPVSTGRRGNTYTNAHAHKLKRIPWDINYIVFTRCRPTQDKLLGSSILSTIGYTNASVQIKKNY